MMIGLCFGPAARPGDASPAPAPQGPGITVAVTPAATGLTLSQSLILTATVTNDSSGKGVTWTVSGTSCSGSACGTLTSASAFSVRYTAPTAAGVYTVTATSVADNTRLSTATIGVTDLAGVYTYRNDYSRSSIDSKEYLLNLSNVNASSFGKLFACSVDQAIYAQPLWVANASIGGGTHNIVIVATEANSVYAFDADNGNGTACTQYWKVNLGTPVPASDTGETGDIQTEIGITATPVIDPTTNALYVVAKTKESGNYFQRLHKLNLSTGAEMSGSPVAISASVSGTGSGSSGGTLSYSALHENPRPGLALVNGSIYITAGSHGDVEPWHGWILQYNASTLAQTGVYCATPNSSGGGIWMSGSAPVFDSNNNLYVITSNGTYDGNTEFGDTFLKMATSSGLQLSDWFTPDDAPALATRNGDLGAGGAVTLMDSVSGPHPHLLIGGGKEGILYLVNRDNMGHYNSANNNAAIQTWQVAPDLGNYGGVSSSGEFWQNTFYIAGSDTPLEAFAFNTSTGMFNTTPISQSNVTFGFPGVTPAVSALGTANGIVWAIDSSTNGTNGTAAGPAVLYAFDASNLANELWDSTMGTNNQASTAVKFAVPTVANGKVYVATTNALDVYGLLSQGPSVDAPTFSPAPGTYTSAQSVSLSDSTSGATIYYTLDGSAPTTASNVYTAPINVGVSTTINAMAAAPGLNNSSVSSGTFTIQSTGSQTITYAQGAYATPQSASTSVNVTFPNAQTAGDLNVVVVGWNDATRTVTSVKDTENNSYSLAVGPTVNASGLTQAIYYAKNITSAPANTNIVTVTFSGAASYPDVRVAEYRNADQNSPVDVGATATGSGAVTSVTASAPTTNANDLLFAANIVTTTTSSPGSGFTARMITSPDADIVEDRTVGVTGTYSATANLGSSGQWIMQMVAFKAASGAPTDTTPPTAPSNLTATAVSDNQINLSWTASTDNVGVTGYLIERCQGSGCTSFAQVATSTGTTYTDAGDLLGATPFTYRVRATDAAGNLSDYSNVAGATTLADTTPPSVPTNVTATAVSTSQIHIAWSASTDDVGVVGYNVQRCQGVSCTSFAQIASPRTNSVDDTGLSPATSYSYRVQATDYAGNLSDWSAIATTTTPNVNPPTVASVSPSNGPTSGGTSVTITGTNFASGATVTFGTAAATNVVVVSSTQITATTPPNAAGAVTITVSVNGQNGNLTNGFTYTSPVSIGYAQVAAATPQAPTSTVSVTFPAAQTAGDLNIIVVGWNDTTSIVQSVKDSAGNIYNLAVGPTAGSGVSQSIYYASNIAAGNNTVTVTFSQAAAYPDIRILEYKGVTTLDAKAGASGSGTTANSGSATTNFANELIFGADTITTTTAAVGSGFTSRIVTSPDSDLAEDKIVTTAGSNSATATLGSGAWVMQMATFYAGVAAPAPTVTGVSPNTGSTLGGTAVTITGTNFVTGATVKFGTVAATNVTVSNSTNITATTPAGTAGAVTVTVTNPDTQSASLAGGFTYVAPVPTVSSVSPNSGSTAGGTAVTITGTNFVSGATVTFGSAAATNVAVVSSTQITATTPAGSAGSVTVTVTNPGAQSGNLPNGFTYVVTPTVSGVSPNNGPAAGGTSVTITGTNFASGATVTFGTAPATNVIVTNSTTITATTPANAAGSVAVTVTVNGQSGSLPNGFTYVVPPTVTGVSPNSGSTGGGTAVTITGANFASGATVTFGSAAATNVVVVSSTQITATTPAGSAGPVTVTVTNPGTQSGALTNGFTYVVVPTVSNVSPSNGPTAGGTAVTITGTNFASGATVTFGTAAATNMVVVSSTQITATTPANAAGPVAVKVTLNGQSGTLPNGFTYAVPPTVSAVSPNIGSIVGGTIVTITGTNFVSGASVAFGAAPATNVSITNSTTITATTPANSAGSVTVTVTNPTGLSGGLANAFTYSSSLPPIVTSVYPNNGPTSGGTGVTITGANFVSGASVMFGATPATSVTVSSSTTIFATTPANTAGAVTVTVNDPGGLSGSLTSAFTYTPVVPISFVQVASATPQSPSASVSVTYQAAETLGDMNIVVVGWNDTSSVVKSVSDSAGNTYYLAVGPTLGSGLSQSIYYASNIVGGSNTVNVTFSQAAVYPDVRILEYKGVEALDTTAGAGGTGTAANSGAATTAIANELIIGADTISTTEKAVGSGFTSRIVTSPDSDLVEDKIVTTAGSNSATATLSSGAWVMQMATFHAGGGGLVPDTTPPSAPTNLVGPAPIVQNVQSYINSTALTTHTTAPFDSTGGDAIVVFASSHAGVTMTPSDSFNNTWISIAGPTNTSTGFDLRSQIWYAKNPTVGPGHTFTLNLSAAQSLVISIFVLKGSNVSSPIDVLSAIGDDAGTQSLNVTSPSIITTNAYDTLLGFVKSSVGETFTAGTGYTFEPAASSNFLAAENESVAAAGTYNATFALSGGATWQSAIVAVAPSPNSVTSNQISISWSPSTDNVGVTGYLIERCQGAGCSNFAQIATTTATSYTDTGLAPETVYTYRVRATDAASNLSAYSGTVSVETR